jgi:glyoxylase-like metal-dependent hydrolase (beta-lactamase superfamily II)
MQHSPPGPLVSSYDLRGTSVALLLDAWGSFMNFRPAFPGIADDLVVKGRARYSELFDGERWTLPFRTALITGRSGPILVDAGIGPGSGDLLPEPQERLPTALAAAGVAPAEVRLVFFTHLHVDHVGWAAVDRRPFFPNARYLVSVREWDFVCAREASREPVASKLKPLERAGVLDRLDHQEVEIAPGVIAFPTQGHTPGHMSLTVTGTEGDACVLGDVVVHPLQIDDPGLAYIHEENAREAAATRLALYQALSGRSTFVLGGHLPGTGAGHIAESGGWRPVSGTLAVFL